MFIIGLIGFIWLLLISETFRAATVIAVFLLAIGLGGILILNALS